MRSDVIGVSPFDRMRRLFHYDRNWMKANWPNFWSMKFDVWGKLMRKRRGRADSRYMMGFWLHHNIIVLIELILKIASYPSNGHLRLRFAINQLSVGFALVAMSTHFALSHYEIVLPRLFLSPLLFYWRDWR